jgi:hypothetical protein
MELPPYYPELRELGLYEIMIPQEIREKWHSE